MPTSGMKRTLRVHRQRVRFLHTTGQIETKLVPRTKAIVRVGARDHVRVELRGLPLEQIDAEHGEAAVHRLSLELTRPDERAQGGRDRIVLHRGSQCVQECRVVPSAKPPLSPRSRAQRIHEYGIPNSDGANGREDVVRRYEGRVRARSAGQILIEQRVGISLCFEPRANLVRRQPARQHHLLETRNEGGIVLQHLLRLGGRGQLARDRNTLRRTRRADDGDDDRKDEPTSRSCEHRRDH